jgi:acetyltransferase
MPYKNADDPRLLDDLCLALKHWRKPTLGHTPLVSHLQLVQRCLATDASLTAATALRQVLRTALTDLQVNGWTDQARLLEQYYIQKQCIHIICGTFHWSERTFYYRLKEAALTLAHTLWAMEQTCRITTQQLFEEQMSDQHPALPTPYSLLHPLFYPRGVTVVGSVAEGKLGYELIRQMVDGGYRDVFPVNPKAQGALGFNGYTKLSAIGQPVDVAVIVSPPPTVSAVLTDCAQAGVQAAVIITAGFSETGNHAGEAELKRVAAQYGIRFLGPNCAGMVNTHHHLYPTLETRPPTGGVSLIAQSGAVGGIFLAWAKEFGLGISKFVSYGNAADLNEIDLLRYMADDADTTVVALYIETVADGREFMQAVTACARRKPVVVIKAGRTQAGQRATLSHTGSLAGADAVYDAALRQCGAIRVHSVEEAFDVCKALSSVPRPAGRRVIIVTNSGGPGVMAADRAEEVGLEVAEPSPALKEKFSTFLPPHCALKNPIDLTVEGTEDGYRKTLLAALEEYDAALALNIATPYLDSLPLARGVCDAAQHSGKPVLAAFLPAQIVADSIPILESHGVPNFAAGERAATALAKMCESMNPAPLRVGDYSRRISAAQFTNLPTLEPDAMAWLGENGLPVPEFRFATTADETVFGSREIGYPVVIKVVSPDILHKSDVGGVIVGVRDDDAAREAFERLRQAAGGAGFRGVVIYPLIRDAVEVLLGLSRDPQFGPVLAFGLGGIYTEVWRDVALRVAPVEQAEAEAMIREIKAFPLLAGVRGQPARDMEALADTLVTFSHLPFRYPEISEVDLNPVFLLKKGLVVGDVRVIRKT